MLYFHFKLKTMKQIHLLLLSGLLIMFAGCTEDDELIIPEVGEIKIEAHDDDYYSFALKKGQIYTLTLDFSEYNYNPKIEVNGQKHWVRVDFGIPNYVQQLGNELGNEGDSDYLCFKSDYCFIPTEDLKFRIQVEDDDYSDNTGFAIISMQHGSVGFEDGQNTVMITDKNKLFPVPLLPYQTNKINIDFSDHTAIPDVEPKGWRIFYKLYYGDTQVDRRIAIGDAQNPKVYMQKESVSIYTEMASTLNYQIYDSNPSEENGEVYLNY